MPSKICKTCDIIIDGTELEEITKHKEQGHEVVDDNRTGQTYSDDVKRRLNTPQFTEYSLPHEYADCLQQNYKFKTYSDTKEILVYKDGIYQKNGDTVIAEETQRLASKWCSKRLVSEVEGVIQRRTFTDRRLFNNDFSKIVVENGILDLDTLTLSPFDPEFLTTVKISITYDPNARHPSKFLKFLEDSLQTKENIITAVESVANILTANRTNFEVSIINIGRGGNGKSSFLSIIQGIFGIENGCDVSIHEMMDNKYALASLDGKLFNIHDDISNRDLLDMGDFKRSISGKPMDVEQKFVKKYTIVPFAKHFFSANEMPKIKDNSDGTFRKIYLIKWENQFLPGVNRIDDIDKKILENEKSAIFNIILRNYRSLIRQKGFRYKQSIDETRSTILQESDKLQEFVNLCLVKKEGHYIIKDEMYQKLAEYFKFKGYSSMCSKVALGSKLPQYGLKGIAKKIDKKTHNVWIDYTWNLDNEWVKSNIRKSEDKPIVTQEILT